MKQSIIEFSAITEKLPLTLGARYLVLLKTGEIRTAIHDPTFPEGFKVAIADGFFSLPEPVTHVAPLPIKLEVRTL